MGVDSSPHGGCISRSSCRKAQEDVLGWETRRNLFLGFGHGQIQMGKFQGFPEKHVKLFTNQLAAAKSLWNPTWEKQSLFVVQIFSQILIGICRKASQIPDPGGVQSFPDHWVENLSLD